MCFCSILKPGLVFTLLLSSHLFLISLSHCLCVFLCWFTIECVCTDSTRAIFAKLIPLWTHTQTHSVCCTADRSTVEAGKLKRTIKDVQSLGLLKYRPEGWRRTEESGGGFLCFGFCRAFFCVCACGRSNQICFGIRACVCMFMCSWFKWIAQSVTRWLTNHGPRQRCNYPMTKNVFPHPHTYFYSFKAALCQLPCPHAAISCCWSDREKVRKGW